jgi:hypothetical protein
MVKTGLAALLMIMSIEARPARSQDSVPRGETFDQRKIRELLEKRDSLRQAPVSGAQQAIDSAASKPVISSAMPAAVASEIRQAGSVCDAERPSLKPGFVTEKDINGDGVNDYILVWAI